MSRYFDWTASLKRFVRFDTARSEDVNDALDELTAGLDDLDLDVNRSIKLPTGTADQTLALGAGARANKVLAFDGSGNITVSANSVDSAAASAAAAAASQTAAASSASAASTSASNAASSASSASTSASTATTQAGIATTQATNAAASYDAFDDRYLGNKSSNPTVDNDGAALLTGALYFNTVSNEMRVYTGSAWVSVSNTVSSDAAAASAATATTQAGIATTQAGNASTSATAAATSASSASSSATAAASSATSASGSASTATTQASTATTAATTATTQAGIATTQAGIATTQATNSSNSATASAASATTASNAATTATTQAGIATTKAGEASTSATSAATSAANAALVGKQYLGAKTSDPTLDNDGNALMTGALYYNSVAQETRVYTGSSWKAAGSAVNGTSARYNYTATASQTTFSATYDVGFVDVYLNGIKLIAGTDFTATSGTDIVLATGAAAGDTVDIVAYGAFSVANTYTVAQTDALLAGKQDIGAATLPITIEGGSVTFADYPSSGIARAAVALGSQYEMIIVGGSGGIHAVVWDKTNKVFGSPVLVRSASWGIATYGTAIAISSTQAVVVTCPGTTALEAVCLTISGTTITVGTAATATLGASLTSIDDIQIVGSSVVVSYARGVNYGVRALTVSGSTVTIGSETLNTGTTSALHVVSSSVVLVVAVSPSNVLAIPYTVSGTTLTEGTGATTAGTAIHQTGVLSTGRWYVIYTNSTIYGAVISVSGTTATISAVALTATNHNVSWPVDSGKVLVAGTTQCNVLTDSSGTAVAGTAIANTHGTHPVRIPGLTSNSMIIHAASGGAVVRFTYSGNEPALTAFAAQPFNASDTYTPYAAGAGVHPKGLWPLYTLCDSTKAVPMYTVTAVKTNVYTNTSVAAYDIPDGAGYILYARISKSVGWGAAASRSNGTQYRLARLELTA